MTCSFEIQTFFRKCAILPVFCSVESPAEGSAIGGVFLFLRKTILRRSSKPSVAALESILYSFYKK